MNALATALFAAALALTGKIGFDLWTRLRERRSVAAALAGEIGAFIGIMIRMNTAQNFSKMIDMPVTSRQRILPALNKAPTEFHVFDKMAGKIGLLPHDITEAIVAFYNAFESFRLIFNNFSEPNFVAAPTEFQDDYFKQAADLLEVYASNQLLRDRLHRVVR